MKLQFSFGLHEAVPAEATAAWGARWIFPDDMLPDRQSFPGMDTPEGQQLRTWLNGGALHKARTHARKLADQCGISHDSDKTVTLFEDETGKIVGNPRASYGYLYVAGWIKTARERLLRADYLVTKSEPPAVDAPGFLGLIDQDCGSKSVTNDAENVIRDLTAGYPVDEYVILYQDSLGNWDRIVTKRGAFACFASCYRARTFDQAKAQFKGYWTCGMCKHHSPPRFRKRCESCGAVRGMGGVRG